MQERVGEGLLTLPQPSTDHSAGEDSIVNEKNFKPEEIGRRKKEGGGKKEKKRTVAEATERSKKRRIEADKAKKKTGDRMIWKNGVGEKKENKGARKVKQVSTTSKVARKVEQREEARWKK